MIDYLRRWLREASDRRPEVDWCSNLAHVSCIYWFVDEGQFLPAVTYEIWTEKECLGELAEGDEGTKEFFLACTPLMLTVQPPKSFTEIPVGREMKELIYVKRR